MGIERLVYECCKVGIEHDSSGGQIYSYTLGMKKLHDDSELNFGQFENYKAPEDFSEDSIAPLTYTYEQLDTLFPRQFCYKMMSTKEERLFAFANNRMSVDWGSFSDYNDYLNKRGNGRDNLVEGRSNANEFYIVAGNIRELQEYPCMYFQSEDLQVPFSVENFCSGKKPEYMQPLNAISIGGWISKEKIRHFVSDDKERIPYLKKMLYCLLRYDADSTRNYSRNLVICDEHTTIIYWIAALTFLFSKEQAVELSFSTYEHDPMVGNFRICGAFPRGTVYRAENTYKSSYIFDFWNQQFETIDIDDENKEFYDFIVNSFLYAEEELDKFHRFLCKYNFSTVSDELEGAFALYKLLEQKKTISYPEQINKAAAFAKYCTDDTDVKKILIQFINIYVEMNDSQIQKCEESIVLLMNHYSSYSKFLKRLCAEKLTEMLRPTSHISVEINHTLYEKYNALFTKTGDGLFNELIESLIRDADAILTNNNNLSYNTYIAEMVLSKIQLEQNEIEKLGSAAEGRILHSIVGNIVSQNIAEQQLREIWKQFTSRFYDDPHSYLYVVMRLERMGKNYSGVTAQKWISISDEAVSQYVESKGRGKALPMYKALIELNCEEKVLNSISSRSGSNEKFEDLFDDVKHLIMEKLITIPDGEKMMLQALLYAAEHKEHALRNLCHLVELRKGQKYDAYFLEVADKINDSMGLGLQAVNNELLEVLVEIYEQNYVPVKDKIVAVKLLKDLETDIEKGKRHIKSKYERPRGDFIRFEQREFPAVSNQMKIQYIEELSEMLIKIYQTSENIQVIHFYTHLFRLNVIEYKHFLESEIKLFVQESGKTDIDQLAELISYSIIYEHHQDCEILADILIRYKVNINKLNKYIEENNKDILASLYSKLKFDDIEQIRKELLKYWNDVINTVDARDTGIMNSMRKMIHGFMKK